MAGLEAVQTLMAHLRKGLIGHERLIERLMIALLAGGHVLIEGPPGLAKTRAVKLLAARLEGGFARIQCTPDLMPADLTGAQVFRPDRGVFEFTPGPVFHTLALVDEINRAPPKVQSALLEAMAERQVSVGGETHKLPPFFTVIATQNSIEHEGTFPLPEAQLDRFLMHILLELPGAEQERAILDLVELEAREEPAPPDAPIALEDLMAARKASEAVHLSPALKDFIIRLVMATREPDPAPDVQGAIAHAVSPRGTLALAACVKARAALMGRDYGAPDDVVALAPDTLAHRLIPNWRALAEGRTARALVDELLHIVEPL